MKGTFHSVWSCGATVSTPATLNKKSGEVCTEPVNIDPKGALVREYFETPDGDELEVCMTCHSYIRKTVMNPGMGHDLNEETECSDPDCESNS
jgi:hypothetical protein